MDDIFSSQPALELDAEDTATLAEMFAEIEHLNEQMRRDQAEIDRLKVETRILKEETDAIKAETRVVLDRLKAAV